MKDLLFEPVGGASGDMILASLIDLGADSEMIVKILREAGVTGFSLEFEHCGENHGIAYGHCNISVTPQTQYRHLKDLLAIVEKADISQKARNRAAAIFQRLAEAEAAVHDMPIEKVHFHEVGAVDTIVDILGACIALDELGIDNIYCSEFKTGRGVVECSHGILPVPVPAVTHMLAGFPVQSLDVDAELTTPTGAAILTTLAQGNWRGKTQTITKTGTGHGRRSFPSHPNIIRAHLAAKGALESDHDGVEVLETDIDDQSPELTAMLCDELRQAGALDVSLTQVIMKKGRPGIRLTVLALPDKCGDLVELIFTHSSTIGIRQHQCRRHTLARREVKLKTPYGEVRAKEVKRPGGIEVVPEADSCLELGRQTGVPPRKIMHAARNPKVHTAC